MTSAESTHLDRLRATLARRFGLSFDANRFSSLADVLQRRSDAVSGGDADAYLAELEREVPWRDELHILAQEITVPETYFFRNPNQFRAVVEAVLPQRLRAQALTRKLRVLSAGCASGEEAHSLAILLSGAASAGWDVSIHAIDVSGAAIAKAKQARYSSYALRETPSDVRALWFRAEGRETVLTEQARRMVTFEERNLVDADPAFWFAESFDLVFCRNVLMYMTLSAARTVVARIAYALAPGGFLFLGHAETLRELSDDFELRHTHDTFYYERRGASESPSEVTADGAAATPTALMADGGDGWLETIRKASERIAELSVGNRGAAPAVFASPGSTPAPPPPVADSARCVARALDLLRDERFSEAQALVGALPASAAREPDVLLLRAVLLMHRGELREAERVSAELLSLVLPLVLPLDSPTSRDARNAGAHYVMALCRENAGDLRAAVEHSLAAVGLDPSFSMARLHLGLLARRAGDAETARRELAAALPLLEREEASRVLLFGGGFRREALVALCSAELATCGGVR